ncbi:hypothetical protein TorRG33x02_012190 [Trema orientale]|uniref:Uncharacterized protein n=1 Tax=Trema orientale TaxID=63057 RepID=A0A2P5FZD7_TREOI|nr:hypothetical protein TorRG33x02_012190 [Trema orientale]
MRKKTKPHILNERGGVADHQDHQAHRHTLFRNHLFEITLKFHPNEARVSYPTTKYCERVVPVFNNLKLLMRPVGILVVEAEFMSL